MPVKKEHTQEHIVFLGENGFPKGLAAIQRMTLMAKALIHEEYKATVICRKGVWDPEQKQNFEIEGKYEGIDYRYTSKSIFKPKGFINRNIQKLKGLRGEYKYLKYLKRHERLDGAIVSNMSAVHLLRYLIYSAILNFPVILNLVEMASSMQDRMSISQRINDFLVDNWILKYFDGALPISDRLYDYYKTISPSKPILKLPILCDFEKFNLKPDKKERYFLYCGSMAYKEVIDFVLEAYKNLEQTTHTKLYMIISGGGKEQTQQLLADLNKDFADNVRLFSNIPYKDLVTLYINAEAQLIPMRPTVQDTSRFPHKIGEYLASGNPVITTNVGEIRNYFEDGETALVAATYTTDAFTKKMRYVLEHKEKAKSIGLQGKELGLREFDFKTQGVRLKGFLQEVLTAK